MADNHPQFPTLSVNREMTSLVGTFTAGGTGVVTAVLGRGFSVTRAATGVYLVTLASAYPSVIFQSANINSSTTAPNVQLMCSPVVAKSMTITCYALTTTGNGALTDVANGLKVAFCIEALNSSVN